MKKRKLGIIGGSGLYKMEGFAKTKWKKAQARIKVMRTIGKIAKASRLSKAANVEEKVE